MTTTRQRAGNTLQRMVEIRRCPHCFGGAVCNPAPSGRSNGFFVVCLQHNCVIGPVCATEAKAIQAWNEMEFPSPDFCAKRGGPETDDNSQELAGAARPGANDAGPASPSFDFNIADEGLAESSRPYPPADGSTSATSNDCK